MLECHKAVQDLCKAIYDARQAAKAPREVAAAINTMVASNHASAPIKVSFFVYSIFFSISCHISWLNPNVLLQGCLLLLTQRIVLKMTLLCLLGLL